MLDERAILVPDQRASEDLTLLIVDDDEDIRRLLQLQLARLAHVHVVGEACDGSEAVSACGEMRPDVVILDVDMPGTNGLAALQAIGTVSPGSHVIMFSGQDDASTRRTAHELGAKDFVAKGGGRRLLFEALDRVAPTVGPAH